MEENNDLENILESPNAESLEKLMCYVKENPLEIDKNISNVLTYLFKIDLTNFAQEYEALFNELLRIFAKLHRVQNFMAKLIPTLKSMSKKGLSLELLLPESVLNNFEKCIIPMASWQVINLLKTFLFHLKSVFTEEIASIEKDKVTIYVEFLTCLFCTLISSVRMAEHSVSELVLEKFMKCLEEIKELLRTLGTFLVQIEHNPRLMKVFLNMAHVWAEVNILLSYYSTDEKVMLKLSFDNDYAACNLTYLHSYLNSSQWALISQRIANFGEKECKFLLDKLISQKVKAMSMFGDINNEINDAAIKSLQISEKTYKEIATNPYLFKKHINKLELTDVILLAEKAIEQAVKNDNNLTIISEDTIWISALTYVCLSKINKLFKRQKRKLDSDNTIQLLKSVKLFEEAIKTETFLLNQDLDNHFANASEIVESMLSDEKNDGDKNDFLLKSDVENYLKLITKIPVLYLEKNLQSITLFYLFTLIIDLNQNKSSLESYKEVVENIILGILQHGQVNLILLKLETLHEFIIKYFNTNNYKLAYQHVINIVSKFEDSKHFKNNVKLVIKHIDEEKYLQSAVILLNGFTKIRRSKTMCPEDKEKFQLFKGKICHALTDFFVKKINKPKIAYIEAYSLALKHVATNSPEEELNRLLSCLENYIDNALTHEAGMGLFVTILQNKNKIAFVNDALLTKLWNHVLSKAEVNEAEEEEFSKLIVLLLENVTNDAFKTIIDDLQERITKAKTCEDLKMLSEQIRLTTFALNASLGSSKHKTWVKLLEHLMQTCLFVYGKLNEEEERKKGICNSIGTFCEKLIKSQHDCTPLLIDMSLVHCCLLLKKNQGELEFTAAFNLCYSILDALLRDKKSMIMHRLPSYLQQYRLLFADLCNKSNTKLNLDIFTIEIMAQCAHKLERLTRNLVMNTKDMARVAPYVICDILNIFQEISVYPDVKMHLKTCLFSLISLCDKHSTKFIYRNTTCVEILNDIMENAKKNKYRGKI